MCDSESFQRFLLTILFDPNALERLIEIVKHLNRFQEQLRHFKHRNEQLKSECYKIIADAEQSQKEIENLETTGLVLASIGAVSSIFGVLLAPATLGASLVVTSFAATNSIGGAFCKINARNTRNLEKTKFNRKLTEIARQRDQIVIEIRDIKYELEQSVDGLKFDDFEDYARDYSQGYDYQGKSNWRLAGDIAWDQIGTVFSLFSGAYSLNGSTDSSGKDDGIWPKVQSVLGGTISAFLKQYWPMLTNTMTVIGLFSTINDIYKTICSWYDPNLVGQNARELINDLVQDSQVIDRIEKQVERAIDETEGFIDGVKQNKFKAPQRSSQKFYDLNDPRWLDPDYDPSQIY